MKRRELLKFFAAGTIIAPAVSAAPLAQLVAPPEVRLIEPRILQPLDLEQVEKATITMQMRDGSVRTLALSYPYATRSSSFGAHPMRVNLRITEEINTSPVVEGARSELWAMGEVA